MTGKIALVNTMQKQLNFYYRALQQSKGHGIEINNLCECH